MEDVKAKFAYWVTERESIRQKKDILKNPKPWSDDPTFQSVYFCNADREHDKVTMWIRERYQHRLDHAPYPVPSIPNMIMARLVNKPESLDALGWPWSRFHKDKWMEVMSQKGAWGGAYIVSTNGRAMPKHEYIAGLLEVAWQHFDAPTLASIPPTLSGHHKAIQRLQGMGSFMAAQVVADLKNTKGHPLANASDWHEWASHGPGSLRGLEWFHGHRVTPSNFMEALVSARQWCYTVDTGLVAHLCNQNLQNCFCEFDKYMRVSTGAGRSKRKYHGA